MSDDPGSDASEVELDVGDEKEKSQALLDILTLFSDPNLTSLFHCHAENENVPFLPESSPSVCKAFQTVQLKLLEIDELDHLVYLGRILRVPQLLAVLRECIGNQRWPDVVEILRVLSLERNFYSLNIWKPGFEVMMSDNRNTQALMLQLFNKLKMLTDIEPKEVMVEYAKYLLFTNRRDEITQVFETTSFHPSRLKTKRTDEGELMLKCYQGLCSYVEWLQLKLKSKKEQEDVEVEDPYDLIRQSGVSEYADEELMKVHADRAVLAFSACIEDNGVLDLFITKYVELLEYYEDINEAEKVLRNYVTSQPSNPNSHRYLYYFLKRHQPNSEEMTTALQEYVSRVPSDELALELCRVLKINGKPSSEILPMVFNYLDFAVRKEDLIGWQTLHQLLKELFQSKEESHQSVLKECWEIRSTWWPNYHFMEHSVTKGRQPKLLSLKAAVAILLTGTDTPFVQRACQVLGKGDRLVEDAMNLTKTYDRVDINTDPT